MFIFSSYDMNKMRIVSLCAEHVNAYAKYRWLFLLLQLTSLKIIVGSFYRSQKLFDWEVDMVVLDC